MRRPCRARHTDRNATTSVRRAAASPARFAVSPKPLPQTWHLPREEREDGKGDPMRQRPRDEVPPPLPERREKPMRKAIAGTSNTSTVEARRRMWKTGLACTAEALCAVMTGAIAGASMPATQLPPACSGGASCATIGTGAMAVAAARAGDAGVPKHPATQRQARTRTAKQQSESAGNNRTKARQQSAHGARAARRARDRRLEADYGDVLAQLEKLIEEELEEVGIVDLERSVALRIMRGESYREISEHIYYSENAVKYHAKRIFEKAQTSSRHEFEMLVRRNVEKRIGQVNAAGKRCASEPTRRESPSREGRIGETPTRRHRQTESRFHNPRKGQAGIRCEQAAFRLRGSRTGLAPDLAPARPR